MASSLHFNLGTGYPANFPKSISLSATEPLSYLSFEEAFQKAQEAHLPYYSIVGVQSGNKGEEAYCHLYDAIYFSRYSRNCHPGLLTDPCTKRPVQEVHYIALRCFKWDEELICKPVKLGVDNLCIRLVKPTTFKSLLLDSTNANIFVPGKEQAQYTVRVTQFLVACCIKRRKIFRNLTSVKRQQEAMLWLWCSAQGSYQGSTQLVEQCLSRHPKANKIALELLSKRLTHPPTKEKLPTPERLAVMQGFHLLERHAIPKKKTQKDESKEI